MAAGQGYLGAARARCAILLAAAALAAGLSLSCDVQGAQQASGISVSIDAICYGLGGSTPKAASARAPFANARGASIYPASSGSPVDLGVASYAARFSYASSSSGSAPSLPGQTSSSGSFVLSDVPFGTWNATIEASNKAGYVVAAGSGSFTVSSGSSTSATIALYPPAGSGSFAISSWSWPSNAGHPSATLTPLYLAGGASGSARSLDLAISGDSASYSEASAQAGCYLLTLNLRDSSGQRVVWGDFYSLVVLPGCSSSLTVSSQVLSVNVAPVKPSFIAAPAWVDSGSTYVAQLAWAGAGADGYSVYRSSDGGSSWQALATGLSSTAAAYTDSSADYAHAGGYSYFVRATNAYSHTDSDAASLGRYSGSASSSVSRALYDVVVSVDGDASMGYLSAYAAGCAKTRGASAFSPSSYRWSLDGTAIATSDTLSAASIIATGIVLGSYHNLVCEVSDGYWSWSGSKAIRFYPQAGSLKWSYDAGTVLYSSPAIAPADAAIYLCSSGGSGALLSIYDSGASYSSHWSSGSTAFHDTPAISADGGLIYAGSADGRLFVFGQASGSSSSSSPGAGEMLGGSAIASDGTVYKHVGTGLYAFKADGSLKWPAPFALGDTAAIGTANRGATPAIGADGTIYIGSTNGSFFALTDLGVRGATKWSLALSASAIRSSAAIGPGGELYVGCDDGRLYAIKDAQASGSIAWSSSQLGSLGCASPVLSADGSRIYIGSSTGILYAIVAADGTALWSYPAGLAIGGAAALAQDGTIYFGAGDGSSGKLYALDSSGKLAWPSPLSVARDPGPYCPAIGADGTIYFGSSGALYAVFGYSPPASGPWPTFQKNSRRSGNAAD